MDFSLVCLVQCATLIIKCDADSLTESISLALSISFPGHSLAQDSDLLSWVLIHCLNHPDY